MTVKRSFSLRRIALKQLAGVALAGVAAHVAAQPASRLAQAADAERRPGASQDASAPAGPTAQRPRLPASDSVKQLRAFLAANNSASGRFVQTLSRSGGQVLESTSGRFVFARPGRFRWVVDKPFEQVLVADGKQLWFYDKDLEQVTIRSLDNALASTPAAILFGSESIDKGFEVADLGLLDGVSWVDAEPRSTDQGFDRIAIGMRGGMPVAMEVRDAFGRISQFQFSELDTHPKIAADTFSFVPPAGADVIKQ